MPANGTRCSKILQRLRPNLALPHNTNVRYVDAYFGSTRLPIVDYHGGIYSNSDDWPTDEAHNWTNTENDVQINKPIFKLDPVSGLSSSGTAGTLSIRGYDANGSEITAARNDISVTVYAPPSPVSTASVAQIARPLV